MSDKRTDAELMAAARHITKIEEVTLLCDRLEQYRNEVTRVLVLLSVLSSQLRDEYSGDSSNCIDVCRNRLGDLLNGNPIVCCSCGCKDGLEYGPDPFSSEIGGDYTPVWECGPCRLESVREI
jgi:hypothetical protein